MQTRTLQQVGRALIVIGLVVMSSFIFIQTFHLFYPIIFAGVIATMLHPPITQLHRRFNIPRIASALFLFVIMGSFVIFFLFFIFTEMIHGTAYLAEKIPANIHYYIQYIEYLLQHFIVPIYEKGVDMFATLYPSHQQTIEDNLHMFLNQATESIVSFIQHILKKTPGILSFFPQSIAMLIFISIATILLTIDFEIYVNHAKKLIPKKAFGHILHMLHHIKKALVGYLQAQVKLVFLSCVLIYIGFLMIGVEHALTIVVFAAIADFLPYIGIGIIFLPWIVYLFITGAYAFTIQLSILYAVIVLVRQVSEPKLVSAHLNLRPLTALIALFLGFQLWGVIGMLLAPFLLIICVGIYQAGTFHIIWKYITDGR